MFNNNYYEDQPEQPPLPLPHPWRGHPLFNPSLHDAQMDALTDVHGAAYAGLDTRKITGLGIALCSDDWLIRCYLGRLG